MSIEALFPRKPPKREWSGPWLACPECFRTMAMIIQGGREVYHCPECCEAQLELAI